MNLPHRLYRPAALLASLTAGLHLVAAAMGGGAFAGPIVGCLIWLAIAAGLWRGWRGMAYAGFLAGLGSGTIAVWFAATPTGVAQIVWAALVLMAWLCAATLVRILWRPRAAL